MIEEAYSAVWISYSSISDYIACPRLYYLRNIYKDPDSRHKITVMSPPLALGQSVHEVIEMLSSIPVAERFQESLLARFETAWKKVSGSSGGFTEQEMEFQYKKRGEDMLKRLMNHSGPLSKRAVKINQDLPHFWFIKPGEMKSAGAGIILCGKIDWLEYLPESDSVHIVDFKTGKNDESSDSLQLPIYYLLATHCQKRRVVRISYWYIERFDEPIEMDLPDPKEAQERVLKWAKEIVLARKLDRFPCPQTTGCIHCRPYEAVLAGRAKKVGENNFRQDVYVVERATYDDDESRVL